MLTFDIVNGQLDNLAAVEFGDADGRNESYYFSTNAQSRAA